MHQFKMGSFLRKEKNHVFLNEGSGIPRLGQKPGRSQDFRLALGLMMLTKAVLALRDCLGPMVFVAILFLLSSHPEQYPGTVSSGVDLR